MRVLGVVTLRDLVDANVLDTIRESAGFDLMGDPDGRLMVCDFIQASNPDWVREPFFAELDESAVWFDDLRPAFGRPRFYFENSREYDAPHSIIEMTEMLLE